MLGAERNKRNIMSAFGQSRESREMSFFFFFPLVLFFILPKLGVGVKLCVGGGERGKFSVVPFF